MPYVVLWWRLNCPPIACFQAIIFSLLWSRKQEATETLTTQHSLSVSECSLWLVDSLLLPARWYVDSSLILLLQALALPPEWIVEMPQRVSCAICSTIHWSPPLSLHLEMAAHIGQLSSRTSWCARLEQSCCAQQSYFKPKSCEPPSFAKGVL